MKLSAINIGLIWAVVTGTVTAVLFMFATFASAKDVEFKISGLEARIDQSDVQAAYGQFYDRLDDYEEALDEGRDELAEEYKRQMEKIRAFICKREPEWERCNG